MANRRALTSKPPTRTSKTTGKNRKGNRKIKPENSLPKKGATQKKSSETRSHTGIVRQRFGDELAGVLLIGLSILLFTGSYFEERGIIYIVASNLRWLIGGTVWYLLFILAYSGYLKFKSRSLFNSLSCFAAWGAIIPVLSGLLQLSAEVTGAVEPGGRLGWMIFHHLALLTSIISTAVILVIALLLLLMAAFSLPLTHILQTPWLLLRGVSCGLYKIVAFPLYWLHKAILFLLTRIHKVVLWIIEDLSTIGDYIAKSLFGRNGSNTLSTRFTRRAPADTEIPVKVPPSKESAGNNKNEHPVIVATATIAEAAIAAASPAKVQEISGGEKTAAVKEVISESADSDSPGPPIGERTESQLDPEEKNLQEPSSDLVPVVRGEKPVRLNRAPLRLDGGTMNPDGSSSNASEVKSEVNDKSSSVIDSNWNKKDGQLSIDKIETDNKGPVDNTLSVNDKDDPRGMPSAKQKKAEKSRTKRLEIRADRAGKNAQLKLFSSISSPDDDAVDVRPWKRPSASIFEPVPDDRTGEDEAILRERGEKLVKTLAEFKIEAKILKIVAGPTITQFQIKPASGIKLSKITALSSDIAMALACKSVRIEAPIPGLSAVGIEVPNEHPESVLFSELLTAPAFKKTIGSKHLTFALGKSIEGKSIIADLSKMPHLLVAGTTGSGKSVCINTILASILCRTSPDEVRMLMIDPKMVELTTYNKIPHLISDVITNHQDAGTALRWAVLEMERRYKYLSTVGARDIASYNKQLAKNELYDENGDPVEGAVPMPYMVIVIDELADLMMVAAKEIEACICRLAQMARAVGMHLIVATQRPSTNVITGVIKANFPSRIAFAVMGIVDSKVIIDTKGAEALLGAGDMLYHPVGQPKPVRIQGAFITEAEIKRLTAFLREQGKPDYINMNVELVEANAPAEPGEKAMSDDMWETALRFAIDQGEVSTSLIQRYLKIGYNRAASLVDAMYERGIISGQESGRRRKVLIGEEQIGDFLG